MIAPSAVVPSRIYFSEMALIWAFTEVLINLTASFVSSLVVALRRASYASSGNLLSMTIGPGGLGRWIKQSARLPLGRVACQV